MIQAIYREEKKLADLSSEECLEHCQLTVKPLVEAYFAWTRKMKLNVLRGSKTYLYWEEELGDN